MNTPTLPLCSLLVAVAALAACGPVDSATTDAGGSDVAVRPDTATPPSEAGGDARAEDTVVVDPDAGDEPDATADVVVVRDVATVRDVVPSGDAAADAGGGDFTRAMYQGSRESGLADYQSWYGPRAIEVVGDYNSGTDWSQAESTAWIVGGSSGWVAWVAADAAHRGLNVAVPPYPAGGSLHACAAGDYDVHYRAMGTNYARAGLGRTVFRFGWEEDGNWFRWTVLSQDSAGAWDYDATLMADFRGCFQHFSRAIKSTDPQAVAAWDAPGDATRFVALYPDDDVVDDVSHDVYDWSWAANTYPFPTGCDVACMAARQATVWNTQIGPRLIAIANFATLHHKPMDLGEWGIASRLDDSDHLDHGGLDDPDFIQHIHDLMLGRLPGMTPGFRGGYASYFEALADGGATDTRLHTTAMFTTRFPRAAALYRELFGH